MNEPAELVVFGWGNPSRGDDGLGPALMSKIQNWLEHNPGCRNIALVEDFQLQVEHSLDLSNRTMALFIDACAASEPAFEFRRLVPDQDSSFTTHQLSPAAVLHVFKQIRKEPPPPSFLLCVGGLSFELGQPLSQQGMANLEAAWSFLSALLHHIDPEEWERHLTVR